MKKFIVSILSSSLMNCRYTTSLFCEKIEQLTGYMFPVKEIKYTPVRAVIQVNNTIRITFTLSPTGYVKGIDVKEL